MNRQSWCWLVATSCWSGRRQCRQRFQYLTHQFLARKRTAQFKLDAAMCGQITGQQQRKKPRKGKPQRKHNIRLIFSHLSVAPDKPLNQSVTFSPTNVRKQLPLCDEHSEAATNQTQQFGLSCRGAHPRACWSSSRCPAAPSPLTTPFLRQLPFWGAQEGI